MTEEDALVYFDTLPVDDRLRLMQKMLADMEYRVARARAELGGNSPASVVLHEPEIAQPDLPGLDLPPPGDNRHSDSHDPVLGQISNDDWAGFELPPESGGPSHAVHRLRLMDAAAQYERLLKRYGYIKGQPGLGELTRRLRADRAAASSARQGSTWSDWVAKDQETLDRPKPVKWQDWVVIGDDDSDY